MSIEAIKQKLVGIRGIGQDDFADLPRDEKQMAYELWAAAQRYESKPERRLRRGILKTKWARRYSQIKAAAKQRGKPEVTSLTHLKKGRGARRRQILTQQKMDNGWRILKEMLPRDSEVA